MTAVRSLPAQTDERGTAAAVDRRLGLILVAEGHEPGTDPAQELAQLLRHDQPGLFWLLLAVMRHAFPLAHEMDEVLLSARLSGSRAVVDREIRRYSALPARERDREVRVATSTVLVDVDTTIGTDRMSGIQRVVRESAARWARGHSVELVAWDPQFTALRRLRPREREYLLGETATPDQTPPEPLPAVVVPWGTVYLLPELPIVPERNTRVRLLSQYAASSGVIGHDCVPITSYETAASGMGSSFVTYLGMLRHAARIAVTSDASRAEFEGWRAMVQAAGFAGPDIAEVTLPVQAQDVSAEQLAQARELLCLPGMPTVLVVGSHEPRKNHLAVLHAAETLWREGVDFNLVMIGATAWHADIFNARVDALRAAGRPVFVVSGVSDGLLWAGYRLARCVVFPSLNEGFGLPVAEALAVGTPVVTSGFGSMRQIVTPDGVPAGGVLVDPHDDGSIADALRSVLTDEVAYRRLRAEAAARSMSTWDGYAESTWQFLTGGKP